jgi:hypothetical protein
MIQIYDNVTMRGYLKIRVLDGKTGKAIRVIQTPNTVCRGAKDAMQRLSVQVNVNDASECCLWSIWAGTDNTAPVNTQLQLVSVPGDWFRKVFDAPPTIDVGGVEGLLETQMTMLVAEGNGKTYNEVGLFSQGDNADPTLVNPGVGALKARMFARQIHADIVKTAAIALEYTWRFQFTV